MVKYKGSFHSAAAARKRTAEGCGSAAAPPRVLNKGENPMKNKTRLFHTEPLRFLFACLASFLALAVCSKSSFLYPMNDWVDVHCFFTVGRGILHGLTPYRDLYEQKGPLVYFLYAAAGAVSENSFAGVFLLEGLFFACFVYLGGRLAETLSSLRGAYWPAAAALAVLVPLSPAFSHGSSAEEFFLPVLALGLWLVLAAMKEKRPLSDRQGLLLGLCAAAALWTKYTFGGLFVGLAAAVILWYCLDGMARKLPRLIGFFLLGFVALSALVAAWFAAKGALKDLWQAYFVNNLSQYSQNIRSGVYDPPLKNLFNNLTWSLPGMLGLLWLLLTFKKRAREAAACFLSAVCLFVFTYLSGRRYPYYALVMAVFTPLGLAALSALLRRVLPAGQTPRRALAAALTAALILGSPFVTLKMSPNTYLMHIEKADLPPYRFARTIREAEDQTLLNYGFLDGGFYFAAGVTPSNPFFCTLNIDLPAMNEALQRSIRQGETAFVVTRQTKLKNNDLYQLVDECSLFFESRTWHYYLYQRVTDSL